MFTYVGRIRGLTDKRSYGILEVVREAPLSAREEQRPIDTSIHAQRQHVCNNTIYTTQID